MKCKFFAFFQMQARKQIILIYFNNAFTKAKAETFSDGAVYACIAKYPPLKIRYLHGRSPTVIV